MPYKDLKQERAQANLRGKALRKRRLEAGLCPKCPTPRSKESVLCDNHREKLSKFRKNKYKLNKESNLCVNCKNPPEPNHLSCAKCLLKYRKANKLKECIECHTQAKKGQKRCGFHTKIFKKKIKARLKTRIQEKVAQKLCYECSEPALEGRIRCEYHLKKGDEATRKYQENQRIKGLCRCCPEPASLSNKWFCEYHAEMFNRQRYIKRGSRGIRRALQKKIITERTVRILKSEIQSENWSQEVEDFIRNNAELFKDPYDKALFQHADLNENLDGDHDEEYND